MGLKTLPTRSFQLVAYHHSKPSLTRCAYLYINAFFQQTKTRINMNLVGGFNPFEENIKY